MNIEAALKPTGYALRLVMGQTHIVLPHKEELWLCIGEQGHLQVASKAGKAINGNNWLPCPIEHPFLLDFLEQFNRPVQRTGRICDILTEGTPALIEMPGGKTRVFFDGKQFATELLLDDIALFDRGWKIRAGHQPLKLIGCSS